MTSLDADRFRAGMHAWARGGDGAVSGEATVRALAAQLSRVVLVEGVSDQAALAAAAELRGVDLAAGGVCVVPLGGAMSYARYLRLFAAGGLAVGVCGLCDEAEEGYVRTGLARSGREPGPTRADLAKLGFHVCVTDLEDELIRAHGPAGVERVLAAERDLARFRRFQNQPAQRDRPIERQLRRFMGTTSGRKAHYARALTLALAPTDLPEPLDRLLTDIEFR
jgi:hypothetical protein